MASANDLLEELEKMDPTDPLFQKKFQEYRQLGKNHAQQNNTLSPNEPADYTKKMQASPNKQEKMQLEKARQFRKEHHIAAQKPEPLIKDDYPGFDKLKKTLQKVQQKHLGDPLASYTVAASDAKKLAQNLKNLSLASPYAKRMTQDLDNDLVKLDEIHSLQFKETKKKCLQVLHDFDQKAKKRGFDVPERQIDQLMQKSEIEKEKMRQYPTINDLPDDKPANSHGLHF